MRTPVLVFSLFAVTTLASAQASIKPEALEHKTKGLAFDRAGDLEAALREYTEAIRLQPDYALAFYDRGVVYNEIGNFEEAIADYRRAIAFDSTKSEYRYNLGTVLMKLKRFDVAIEEFKAAKALAPDNLSIRQNLGATYCDAGRHKEAAAEFDSLLAIDPEWNIARPCLIKSLLSLGQTQRALAVSEDYLRLEPDDADGWAQSASILRSLNQWGDAEKAAEMQAKILRANRDPRLGIALWRLAEAYDHNGKIVDARRTYQASIKELRERSPYGNELKATESSYSDFLVRHNLEGAKPKAPGLQKPAPQAGKAVTKAAAVMPPLPPTKTAAQRWQEADQKVQEAAARNDFPVALTQAQSAADLARAFGEETEEYPQSLLRISEIYGRMGRSTEQEKALGDAVAEAEKRLGDASDFTANANDQAGQFYAYQQNNNSRALPFFQRAFAIRRKLAGESDAMTVQSASYTASTLRALHREPEAITLLEDLLKNRTLENTEYALVTGFQQLGYIYSQTGAFEKAEQPYRMALALTEKQFGTSHPALQGSIGSLADVLRKEGKTAEADALAQRLATLKKP